MPKVFSFARIKSIIQNLMMPGDHEKMELPDAEVVSVAVDGSLRGTGIGKQLMERAFAEVEKRQVAEVKVSVGEKLPANHYYQKLGFDWAHRHPEQVKGICYMEAIVQPMAWDEWPEAARGIFEGFRSPAGEEMILENNVFVENVLPGSIVRTLSEEEMAVYRRPFTQAGEDRRPTLTWPRQIPLGGEPADVVAIVSAYGDWLSSSDVPKLFVNAEPGAILTGSMRDFCRTWPNQTELTVKGNHFVQEDSPDEIGEALAQWRSSL